MCSFALSAVIFCFSQPQPLNVRSAGNIQLCQAGEPEERFCNLQWIFLRASHELAHIPYDQSLAMFFHSLNRIAPDLRTTKKVPSIRLMMSVKLAVMTCKLSRLSATKHISLLRQHSDNSSQVAVELWLNQLSDAVSMSGTCIIAHHLCDCDLLPPGLCAHRILLQVGRHSGRLDKRPRTGA